MPDLSALGLLIAFLGGTVSFVSPCVLPLVPGYVSYVAGQSTMGASGPRPTSGQAVTVGFSVIFVIGFTTVFAIMGAGATALGQLFLNYRYELNIIGGSVVLLMGVLMLGLASIPGLQRDFRFHLDIPGGKPLSAYILGLAFGFGWTPCIGPVLGTILTVSAAHATVGEGVLMLVVYSLGLGLPFILSAAFTSHLTRNLKTIKRFGRRVQQFAGLSLVFMGIAMITGQLTVLAYWLLDMFPALGKVG